MRERRGDEAEVYSDNTRGGAVLVDALENPLVSASLTTVGGYDRRKIQLARWPARVDLERVKNPMNESFRHFKGTDSYLTNEALEAAVNCALALERPLLVKGEPGTGKTLLAEAIAEGARLPLLTWNVKSTTRAQDGLYVYDTVQRLYDSRFGDGDVKDIRHYIKLGPLGQAFAADERVVLLIDEVDKADLEFPNDLLHELDRMRFRVTETERGDRRAASGRS